MNYCLCFSSKIQQLDYLQIPQFLSELNSHQHASIESVIILNKGKVIQKLAGKEEEVLSAFNHIKTNQKHDHITLLFQGKESKSFNTPKKLYGIDLETWDYLSDYFEGNDEEINFLDHFQGNNSFANELIKHHIQHEEILIWPNQKMYSQDNASDLLN